MWYAAQVHSNFEGFVTQALSERKLDAFYPFSERTDQRKRVFRRPFFPGYVFFESELDTNQERHEIITVPKVVRIVGSGGNPEPIPADQVFAVRKVADYAAQLSKQVEIAPTAAYEVGEPITVTRGSLAGVRGQVVYLKNRTMLMVQVDMLGRSCSVELDAGWIAKAA